MRCANQDCCSALFDQPGGSLWLMELETSHTELMEGEDNGFPICSVPMKYFWLCVDCSQRFVLRRWTPSGIVLMPKPSREKCKTAEHSEPAASKCPVRVHASPRLEAELLEAV